MAAGSSLNTFTAADNQPPAAGFAVLDTRNSHLVIEYDDTTAQSALFGSILPRNYSGNGITVTIVWMAKTAVAGNVMWGVSFERHQSGVTDLNADSFAAERTAVGAAPGTTGFPQYTAIAFTDGAQINSIAAGESYRLKLRRVAADGADTMVGNAEALRVEVRETP
jgi:hypothetical protein